MQQVAGGKFFPARGPPVGPSGATGGKGLAPFFRTESAAGFPRPTPGGSVGGLRQSLADGSPFGDGLAQVPWIPSA